MTTATVLAAELARSRLNATIGELTQLLYRSAYSTLMRESRDCSISLLSDRGEALVDRPGPFHGSSYNYLVKRVLERYDDLAPGDVFMTNHPYDAGIPHTPDLAVVVPAFVGDTLVGFSASIAHKSDFGGSVIGSASMDATQLYQEGLLLPLTRVARGSAEAELDPGVMGIIAANVRTPDLFFGDMRAQLGVTRVGAARLSALAERTGVEVLRGCFAMLLDQGERALRDVIAGWPDGEATVTGFLDSDGIRLDTPVKIAVTVRIAGDSVEFDLTGSDDQTLGPVNMTKMYADSAVFYAVISCAAPDFGFSDSVRRVVTIKRRPGSLFDPNTLAPVGAATSMQHRLVDLCFEALGMLVPGAGSAHSGGSGGTVGIEWASAEQRGRSFQYEVLGTAMGAVHDSDGVSGVTAYYTNLGITPVEVLESQYPVRINRFELITDSAGAGRYRGGLSYRREYEALAPASVRRRSERGRFPARGVAGGHDGSLATVSIRRSDGTVERLPVAGRYELHPHDLLTIEGSGAGGYGDPRERPADVVLADVRAGAVSVQAAAAEYGVVIDERIELDEAGTRLARQEARR
ncbi:hydantoinase B/oxoprolinase family protein [Rugosimonospora africana]|uniref:Hydantoin utilization protein B n=1 Tax=Rugosimonospora africana TaxID=556532 RepID=A0A8J3QX83_9ACTN|nr:hydantoinase B/oxoprolinase family protein [Rugosimonospora africana]GIH17782.1 hydantoin utilization protein B [Rugosimonospora africana]